MTVLRRGFDASFSLPSAQRAAQVGYTVAMRYLSHDPGKNLTATEVATDHALGIDVGLNWETTTNATLQGFAQGVADATEANHQADQLGAPQNVCIYYSTDTGATADQVRAYYQGAKSIKRRPVGGYGGSLALLPLLNEGTISKWWQANAGSWSGFNTSNFPSHPQAHIRQLVTPTLPSPGGALDENEILSVDCGLWPAKIGANLMAFGPSGTRIDLTITGVDGHPYHISADSPEALPNASWVEIGGQGAVTLDILKDGWTADGSKYVVLAKGADGRVWINVNQGPKWFPIPAGAVGAPM
ncbi:MAG: DUF1906 domain-containing protein [Actinomycetota bacterium]|nr:DUF1906 domain-containing protein [Actinomycetota bacterium]